MLDLKLDANSPIPLYEQLYAHLRQQILQGELPAGTRLPSSRNLAQKCGVARITVTQAYEQLQVEGYVEARTGAGTYVAAGLAQPDGAAPGRHTKRFRPQLTPWGERVQQQAYAHPRPEAPGRVGPLIDFGFGRSFPHIFPYDIWRRLLARYLSTDDIMLSRYGSVAGFDPLREAIADYLSRLRGVHCVPEQVVIVSGAQQALDILSRLLLRPGDNVLVENPGYTDACAIFTVQGAKLLPLPVDGHGCVVAEIPAGTTARLAFLTPSNQFPQGGALPVQRRLALLEWARQAGALVIEDDYDGELRYDARPVGSLQGLDQDGRVVYLGTFSKVLFPALRLGYAVLPPALVEPFLQAKQVVDRGAPTLTQAAVADFIREGHFERHLRRLRKTYGRRHSLLVCAVREQLGPGVCFAHEPAGLHLMLFLPPHVDEETAVHRALEAGVRVYPGAPYHLNQPAPPSILLGFSGLSKEQISEGIRRLAAAWQGLLHG